jgi:hypothetical protein
MEASRKQLIRRCPRLGNPVPFKYCKTCGDDQQTCFKIIDCWWEYFDIVQYLKDNLPGEQFNRLIAAEPPKNRVTSLVELIEQARQRNK